MCCLFGILDYAKTLSLKQRQRILRVLSAACEERGTDATGIAYFTGQHLTIQKAPRPAHKMKFRLSTDAHYILGHTRMTTQGSEKFNQNNHPFSGKAGKATFALAHNGVLYNDKELRNNYHLPSTKIQTDSYVAVQLLEREKKLNFSSLTTMAEAVRGSFTFTVLDDSNSLYIVKGNNPMCILHFKEAGFYLYASTQEILFGAVEKLGLDELEFVLVPIQQGNIMRIAADGSINVSLFDNTGFQNNYLYNWGWDYGSPWGSQFDISEEEKNYFRQLENLAEHNGFDRSIVTLLDAEGFDLLDIEDMLYDEEFLCEMLCN